MIPSKALTASLARTTLRDPSTLFFSYVFPSALLVILAQTMGSYPGVRGHSVVDSIGPNVVGIGVTFVGLFAGGMNIAEWRENKMLGVLRCVPLSVSRILMSAFTVALVSAFVQAVLIIVVGIMPWVGMSLSPWALLAVVPVFLGALVFYLIGILVGLVVPSLQAVPLVIMLIVFPMCFASGAMMPLEMLPSWVETLSHFLPMTYLLNGLRWPLTGVVDLSDALVGWGVLAVSGVVLFAASVRLMRWR